jgi:hypothetical protein
MGEMMRYTEDEIKEDELMLRKIWGGEKHKNAKRFITQREKEQRACGICVYLHKGNRKDDAEDMTDQDEEIEKNERLYLCEFKHCPFHEMDKYKTYGDYMRAERMEIDRTIARALNTKIERLIESVRDEILEQFNADLSNTEIEIISNFALIEYIDSTYVRTATLLKVNLSSSDFNSYSPANMLDKLLAMHDTYRRENETLLSRYSWMNNSSTTDKLSPNYKK